MVWLLSRDLLSPQCQQCHGYYRSDRGDRPPCLRSIATENHARFRGFAVSAESAVSQVSPLCLRMGRRISSKPTSVAGSKKIKVVSAESAGSLAPPRCRWRPAALFVMECPSHRYLAENTVSSPTNRPTKYFRLLADHCELPRTIIDDDSRANQGDFELHRTTANHSAADTASATMGSLPTPTALRTSRQPAHCSIWSRLLTHKSSRISRRTPYVCCLAPAHAAAPA